MKRLLIFSALLIAIVSCSKVVESRNEDVTPGGDNDFEAGQEVTLTIGTGIDFGSETRTIALWDGDEDSAETIDTRVAGTLNSSGKVDLTWADGDQIKVTVDSESSVFTMVSNTGSQATFKGVMPASGNTFSVDYPATGTTPELSTQTYVPNGIPAGKIQLSASGCTLGGTIHLKAAQSVLRLNFWGRWVNVGKIVVTNTSSTETPKPSYTLDCGTGVTLGTTEATATPFLLVVPSGSYKISAEVFNNASPQASLVTVTTSSAKTFIAAKMLNMAKKEVVVVPEGALPGIFSVSATKKVYFSEGNLQAKCTTASDPGPVAYSWGFAEHQYDYIGNAPGNNRIGSQKVGDVVDLFGWSTAATNYGINSSTTNDTYKGDFKDWGGISTLPGNSTSSQIWFTLSGDWTGEWKYLLDSRTGDKAPDIGTKTNTTYTDARYAEVMVNSIPGLLIFPDVFSWPSALSSKPASFNAASSDWNNVNYTVAEFSTLESAGCVFLPAAGARFASSLSYVGSYGFYWSSTPYGADAYRMFFVSSNVDPSSSINRYYGRSVRLVTAAP